MPNEVFYDVAMRRLDEQLQRYDSLDTKTIAAFGVSNIILGLYGALLTLSSLPDGVGLALFLIFLALGSIAYAVSAYFGYEAYKPRQLSIRPNLTTLKLYNEGAATSDEVRRTVAEQCVISTEKNDPLLIAKAGDLGVSLKFLSVEVFLLTLTALVVLVTK